MCSSRIENPGSKEIKALSIEKYILHAELRGKWMKKIIVFLVLACLLTLVGCSSNTTNPSASGETPVQKKKLKIALTGTRDISYTKELFKLGEKIEKESGGSIKVEIYPDGQLGKDSAVFDAMKLGTIEASMMSPGSLTSYAQRFSALDLPFLFKDEQKAYEVLDGPIGQTLLDDLPKMGIVGLSYWEIGFRHLTNNMREVKSIDDISGLKIRTLPNPVHLNLWSKLGAVPTPMDFSELFTALEQKVIDGQENPAGLIKTSKFNEIQKYLTKTGHVYSPNIFMVSKKFWDSLSEQEREIINKAVDESKGEQRKLNQQEVNEALTYLAENGMVITELSPEEKQKFMDKARSLYSEYTSVLGEELYNKLLEATK